MRFGISTFVTDEGIAPGALAREIEQRGFDSLFMAEHTHILLSRKSPVHDLLTIEVNPLEGMLERIFILPELKALDHRAQVFETLTSLEQRVISLKRMMT